MLKIFNGKIILPGRILDGGCLLIRNGLIEKISENDINFQPNQLADNETYRIVDAGGNYVSPVFIDIHVHGGGGYDFMDGTEEAFLAIADLHVRYGTTSMVPTTLTSGKAELLNTLAVFSSAQKKNVAGARFLGLHLEGPYISINQCGAQDPKFIRDPDPAEYEEILRLSDDIKRWSAAPELRGATAFGKYCVSRGVLPAIAHTDAVYEDVIEAFNNGYTLVTHLYSAMSGVTRRNAYRFAGVIESAYLIDGMDVEVIADGIHMPPPLLKLAYKIKGADRIALITDAMRAAGMPEGESVLGNIDSGLKVLVEDGVAKLPDRSSFAGSVATADRLVRTMIAMADVPLPEAVRMMTATPARIMKMEDSIGTIATGMMADLVIFDQDITITNTFIKGVEVYNRSFFNH